MPQLDFVEVYGQDNSIAPGLDLTTVQLYKDLDEAIEREDYTAARAIKARIDETLSEGS